ncbi:hypothetical protein UA08_04152 [Talaromyces atroroseus]|uniref:NmrA-like domain-containing protein n=1 Tax=Talaromyces atroroseus TaxID=1441469 RepID=A0A1Q5Q8L7_TALAT|nr:hypothetical protein UA08_04152 [Talaromyces atroroseus]OKL60369.1 hypothetical protein UA08_04152 [Talaromyces atroroseus]
MVKVAFAGGSGSVAQEIIHVLVAEKKHDILILTRKDIPAEKATGPISWAKTDYTDPKQLTQVLQGVHTVLSFIATQDDPKGTVQKNLIDASVQAGVKRFAPSEWASAGLDHLSWYAYKAEARKYLAELNKDKKVLEYSLFQPGMFLNYFTHPYQSSKHIHVMESFLSFGNRRIIKLEGGDDDIVSVTTVQDLANVVARAIGFEGEWPVIGGIQGTKISVGQLIALGEKVRGGTPFDVQTLKKQDLETGEWKTTWVPLIDHPSIPADQVEFFSRVIVASMLLATHAQVYHTSDEWNRLLPDYKFTQAEEFLNTSSRQSGEKSAKGLRAAGSANGASQEHPDRPLPVPALSAGSNQAIEARLGRVEELIEQLVNNAGIAHGLLSSPAECLSDVADDRDTAPRLNTVSPTRNLTTSAHVTQRNAGKYDELSRDLISVWPSQNDLDIICALPVGLSAHLFCRICTPYSSSMERNPPSPREMLQLPPPGSHPVLVARKLLVLGVFLQGIFPSSIQALGHQGASYRELMARVVDKAITRVTTNDELIGSVEGIECIIMEALYQNYTGNLHRAWMAVRRATAVAQMMALHRGLKSPSLKILDPESLAAFNPDQICFRLAEMDRYLSLMLGLPQASLEVAFANSKALEECRPMERMQRIHCVIAGRILQRNEADVHDLATTHDIDKLLQEAAAEMPPQWWLTPSFGSGNNRDGAESSFGDTIRLMDQFTHYHLLMRLHLPYVLRSSSDHRSEYEAHSKITAVNVSREMLSRYIVFRTSNPAHYYCRGADFLAFFATTVICLVHIDSRNRSQRSAQNSTPGTAFFNFLTHSRATDRGMMERGLEIIESMARGGTDAIASKLSRLIHHLLSIETNAANGAIYSTSTLKGNQEGELECNGNLTNGGQALHVYIPYFGTINFERGAISKAASSTAPVQPDLAASVTDILRPDQAGGQASWGPSNSKAMSFQRPSPQLQQHQLSTNEAQGSNSSNTQLPYPMEVSGAEEDWSLQGVDVALFDSLFRGMEIPDGADQETWAQWTA